MKDAIKPYVHPSCLCTTIEFIQEHGLRLDDIAPNAAGVVHDTMSHFTAAAEKAGKDTYKLLRSNKRNVHRLIGGIYGDAIYHHGAGSRRKVSFWDEPATRIQTWINEQISQISADLLLSRPEEFIDWLRGRGAASATVAIGTAKLLALNLAGRALPASRRILRPFKRVLKALLRTLGADKKANPLTQMIRPIGPEDLSPVPAGWKVNGPDFVGIGAPKAGTSWWCALLFEHPDIHGHRYCDEGEYVDTKELCYFPHFGYREMTPTQIQTYRSMFAAPPNAITGEWSVLYLAYPHCLDHLHAAAPDSKIIVMLRNPVDRTLSHINQLINNRAKAFAFTAEEEYLFATFSVYPEAVLNSLYAYGIRRLFALYPREQILVLQYERCRDNPAEEIARTYRFLGVDDTFQPSQITKEINKKQYSLARLTEAERTTLTAYFSVDVEETFRLLPELDRTQLAGFHCLNRRKACPSMQCRHEADPPRDPKVTVLMPIYNGERYLGEAIDSILGQTLRDFELLIIDDGSTDGSRGIIESYSDSRINLVRNDCNLGLVATLNRGLELSRGDYIARMDCDDIALPTRLEKQVQYMDHNPEVGLCGTCYQWFDEKSTKTVLLAEDDGSIRLTLAFENAFGHFYGHAAAQPDRRTRTEIRLGFQVRRGLRILGALFPPHDHGQSNGTLGPLSLPPEQYQLRIPRRTADDGRSRQKNATWTSRYYRLPGRAFSSSGIVRSLLFGRHPRSDPRKKLVGEVRARTDRSGHRAHCVCTPTPQPQLVLGLQQASGPGAAGMAAIFVVPVRTPFTAALHDEVIRPLPVAASHSTQGANGFGDGLR